jgi:hypothetical protein
MRSKQQQKKNWENISFSILKPSKFSKFGHFLYIS